ncbi:uncharacterized protein V1518DRAFT_420529 [Limtongia smithiae]|uniref:uncharacterized protein n=1 Tax=Limtongia smithiae TaxID=1125753 RepID=UPI0034CE91CD
MTTRYTAAITAAEKDVVLPQFVNKGLFGGAITIDLPDGFLDASTFRQVPDNQEVFVSQDSSETNDTSIIIELVERLELECSPSPRERDGAVLHDPLNAPRMTAQDTDEDLQAVQAHYEEIASINSSISGASIVDIGNVAVPKLPSFVSAYLITGTQITEKWGHRSSHASSSIQEMFLILTLGVVRIPEKSTDVLISFNYAQPCTPDLERAFSDDNGYVAGVQGDDVLQRIAHVQCVAKKTISSINVINWGLFQ